MKKQFCALMALTFMANNGVFSQENPVEEMQGAVEAGVSWIKRSEFPSLGNAELELIIYGKKDAVKKTKVVQKPFTVVKGDSTYQEMRSENVDYWSTPASLSFVFGIDSRYEILRWDLVNDYGDVVGRDSETFNRLRQGYFGLGAWVDQFHVAALGGAERRTHVFFPNDSTWSSFQTEDWAVGGLISYKTAKAELYAKCMYNFGSTEVTYKVKAEARRLVGVLGLGAMAEHNFPSGDEYAGFISVGFGKKLAWVDARFGGSYNPIEDNPAFFAGIFLDLDKRNIPKETFGSL